MTKAAAAKAPTVWATMYVGTFLHGKSRFTAKPSVTAGFMCAPLTPPATYTPKATARAQPQVIKSQSPLATKGPKNSAESSPQIVDRHPLRADADAVAITPPFPKMDGPPPRRTALPGTP